ncbi:MAG: nucleotidyltransferase domain-containing protein [Gemmatimonadetes bacterium]|nr:nucleotidyltransferase domain-containing protein [Gemmatimonadota bacterium]
MKQAYSEPDWLRVKTDVELREILGRLRSGLERIYGERLKGLYLYGSYVRGEAVPGSDIDVLVVLDRVDSYWDEIERTSELSAQISLDHDVTVVEVFVPESRWQEGDTPFLRNVRREARAA